MPLNLANVNMELETALHRGPIETLKLLVSIGSVQVDLIKVAIEVMIQILISAFSFQISCLKKSSVFRVLLQIKSSMITNRKNRTKTDCTRTIDVTAEIVKCS